MSINRGYTQVPVNTAPDVPHYVNQALREIAEDQSDQDEMLARLNAPAMAAALVKATASADAAAASAKQAAASAAGVVGPVAEAIAGVLADRTSDAAQAARDNALTNLTEGARLTVHGHSYTPVPGYYVPANTGEWSSKIARWAGMSRVSHGVSSTRMIENVVAAIGTQLGPLAGDRSIPAGYRGVLVLQSQMNDALFGPHTAAGRSGFKHAVRAYLAVATAARRIDASTATATGSFNGTLTTTRASGGSYRFSQGTVNEAPYLEFSGVSSPTGKVHILTLANDTTSPTGIMAVSVNGVDQGIAYVGQGQMEQFVSKVSGHGTYAYSPAVVTVSVPATGTHTVRITRLSGGVAATIYVDALLIPSENPPIVLVCKDPAIGTYTSQANQDNWVENSGPLAALLAEAVNEFPAARLVDLAPGWDPATMAALETDAAKFHPNETGMEHIAGRVLDAVRAEVTKRLSPSIGLR